ncbi:hypothetical protein [Burkholderia puraquae]|uniref:hypothetical protein n=1 Tax=Burkholderia puraquae TaxID=1904757 RepID=UPI0013FDB1AA|nr:hypothetical protein [Burkholderia puraquae]
MKLATREAVRPFGVRRDDGRIERLRLRCRLTRRFARSHEQLVDTRRTAIRAQTLERRDFRECSDMGDVPDKRRFDIEFVELGT